MLILALLACVTEENYPSRSIAVACQRAEECDKGNFEATYDDQADCRDEFASYADDLQACYSENCSFDAQAAAACLQASRTATCEEYTSGDFSDDCNEVYTECADVDLALCIAGAVF